MRCGIDCAIYICAVFGVNTRLLEKDLEQRLVRDGLSIYDLVCSLNSHCIQAHAYKSFFLPTEENSIVWLKHAGGAHYIVLVRKKWWYAYIYDGSLGNHKIAKWRLYLLYSHRYIVCYNSYKEG